MSASMDAKHERKNDHMVDAKHERMPRLAQLTCMRQLSIKDCAPFATMFPEAKS